ncbi:B12-binding domain-containing radical SAM protein [Bacteroidia bacterium]|nr:B12-binding domain-containing radical SAM protein [Bacteroidia bacterium]
MKILFVYSVQKSITQSKPLLGQEGIYFGISTIASVLKKHGHTCELVVLDRRYKQKNISLLSGKIKTYNPQIVAFTAVFSEFDFIYDIAAKIKSQFPDLFLYAGGIHLTLNPHEKYLAVFDAFCVGEGEYATLELVNKLGTKENISDIANLWLKTPEGIVKNPVRPFIDPLDQLPPPDREMWQEWILEPNTRLTLLVGRGCPFNCTYCCNHKLKKVSSGKYVRLRNIKDILEEIQYLHTTFPDVSEMQLEIETLGVDMNWLDCFCNELHQWGEKTRFKLKFSTNLRIFPQLDIESVFKNFKKANITSVTIGLESGNYRIRKEILNRDYSNEIILKTAQLAKNYGIDLSLFNMVGLPTETPVEFADTIQMNQMIQPSFHATSIFFPYPGTELHTMCERMGLLPQSINTKDERQIATLNLPGFSKRQIQKSFDSFHYNVYKAKAEKSKFKLLIFYSMKYLGHNFYANLKVGLIRALYQLKIKRLLSRNFFSIFQKSK